ncbi:MAG: hypothetical protein R6W78_08810 [Bacteroidales bacterium]
MEKEKVTSIFCGSLKKAMQAFILLIPCLLISSSLSSQSMMSADTERVSNVGPMKASLVSSSVLSNYRFYDPFIIRNVNPAGDQFGYDTSTNTLSFQIDRMGETQSREKRLYIVFYNTDVDFIKATRITSRYDETYIVRNFELVSTPDHSLSSALPSFGGKAPLQSKAYDLGVSDWEGLTDIEVKFSKPLNEDFLLTIMTANPQRVRRLSEELVQYFAAPMRLLGRVLGESQYSNYVSFANYHFGYKGAGGMSCNNLVLSTNTYSERINLNNAVNSEMGSSHIIADWNDLKSIRDIDAWIRCMGLQNGQSFIVTRNGLFRLNNGSRQFFVRYAPNGVPSSFAVHDKIGDKLFLGSWYDLNQKILVKENINPSSGTAGFYENSVNYSDLPQGLRQLLLTRSQNLCDPVRNGLFFQVKSASSPTLNLYYAWYVGCPDTRGRGQIVVYDHRINYEVGERFGYEITGPPEIEFIKDTQSHYPIFRFKTLNREVEDLKLKSPY